MKKIALIFFITDDYFTQNPFYMTAENDLIGEDVLIMGANPKIGVSIKGNYPIEKIIEISKKPGHPFLE